MRIAILSDIHGNLPALDAVLADVAEQAPDDVWCGGDLAWSGPWGAECIARVRSEGWVTVRGNTDVWLTGDPQGVSEGEERDELQAMASAHGISEDDARWLIGLPIGHTGSGSILLVHARPDTPFDAPMPDAPAADFRPYEAQAAVIVYAHVHRAFVRRLADGTIVCNTGSVGLPMDGSTASYLIIDRVGPDLLLHHRRVSFDVEACIAGGRSLGGVIGERFIEAMERLR